MNETPLRCKTTFNESFDNRGTNKTESTLKNGIKFNNQTLNSIQKK